MKFNRQIRYKQKGYKEVNLILRVKLKGGKPSEKVDFSDFSF